ncbi:16S rRNA (adenine(1518)-N(6)/adenine(1519)-N(6))-dimethyltransferase RsmA [Gammaproteobacteria bacterium]|nr:16S rRNA (adenine(1518)-N(6)/adenine(1519)-N(6))-dimethyltransferase RsmA [Gammaproteobacteria bacterium]
MHVARKRFGQHFLHDKNIIKRLVQVISPKSDQHIVEIGPGQGALTVPILELIGKIEAIELDKDLIHPLTERCLKKGELNIHQADALKFDFSTLFNNQTPLRIIGNLPYNISTPLIFHLLTFSKYISDMHFMLQKEVVDRIAAPPQSRDYGRLSIMVQYHCEVNALFDIPPTAFYPSPQVQSKIIKLSPYHDIPHTAKNYEHFATVVKTAFSQRRKTIRNSLSTIVTDSDWEKITIDSKLRPEQLGVLEFLKISNHFF